MDDDSDLRRLQERLAAAARERAKEKAKEKEQQTRFSSLRGRPSDPHRPDNPLKAHERHREEHRTSQEARFLKIADAARQRAARDEVDTLYGAWGKALTRAHLNRFEESARIYDHKTAEKKTDLRLISEVDRKALHDEAIREAVSRSQDRIRAVNEAMPHKIDHAIDTAVTLTTEADKIRQEQKADTKIPDPNLARQPRIRQHERDDGRER